MAFYSLGTLPVNYAGVGLLGFGLLMIAMEPFVTSHGVLALGGGLSFARGATLMINVPQGQDYLRVSLWAVGGVTALMLGFSLVVLGAVLRSRRRRVVTGQEGMIGAIGVAQTDISSSTPGMVHVSGELWQAQSTGAPVAVGERIVVERVDGLLLWVHVLTASEPLARGASSAPAVRVGTQPAPGR
jgi:membrane-bound serine protease (ClpP class)